VTDLRSLQERIGGLTGPSLEVNCDLEEHFGEWTNLGGGWRRHKVTGERERYTYVPAPPYTASVDAALALVERLLPEHGISMAFRTPHVMACLGADGNEPDPDLKYPYWAAVMRHSSYRHVDAPMPALALLKALLKALETVSRPASQERG
jgi:hypothetical protein